MESTKKKLSNVLTTEKPKKAVDIVYEEKGGLLRAKSAGQLPHSRDQAYYLKKKQQQKAVAESVGCSVGEVARDMLYAVMLQCKSTEGCYRFVQDVTCAPEPMAVLATDQQLFDMERFCCDPFKFSILGIDPTFNLGEFSVTPIVYKHLLLKDSKSHNNPLVLGPLLIHHRKQFRMYNYFLSTIVGLQPKLTYVQVVGTDGEKALVDAIGKSFPHASQLRCFRHLQQNVETYLRDKQFPQNAINEYTQEIFGFVDSDNAVHEGLVDSYTSEEFDVCLQALQVKWDNRELKCFVSHKSHSPLFYSWFTKHIADIFRNHTLRSLREDVGLGCPPMAFRTNDSESINAILKDCVGFKKQKWAVFNSIIKTAVNKQQQEFEKVIIGLGQYCLQKQYSFLSVQADKWFRMTTEQRLHHIKKFNNTKVRMEGDADFHSGDNDQSASYCQDITHGQFLLTSGVGLPISYEVAFAGTSVPEGVADGIWNKAIALVSDADAITSAPGCGPKDKMVKSKTGLAPHLVTNKKESQYACDDKCPQYKSIAICSHVVAAAQTNDDLESFMKWYRSKSTRHVQAPNLMQLAKHDMPLGAGRKGNRAPRKKVSRSKQALTDENRVSLQLETATEIHGNTQTITNNNKSSHLWLPTTQTQYNIHVDRCKQTTPPQNIIHQQSPTVAVTVSSFMPMQSSMGHLPLQPLSPFGFNVPFVHYPPTPPPPFYGQPPSSYASMSYSPLHPLHEWNSTQAPFLVLFKNGRISVCNGCREHYCQFDEIVIQHEEFRSFTNPQTGLPAKKLGNAYYHCRLSCILQKWPAFCGEVLVVQDEVKECLSDTQKALLYNEFGITI